MKPTRYHHNLLVSLLVMGYCAFSGTQLWAQEEAPREQDEPAKASSAPNREATAETDAEARSAVTTGGSFYVQYAPDPAPIPLNEMFSIQFKVFDAEDRTRLVEGATVTAGAWMPEHNHGTSLQPRTTSDGKGGAESVGFLLHMEGFWELRVGVAANGNMERAVFRIDLEP